MVEQTNQAVLDSLGLCPTCGVEREFVEKTFRWNFTGADANESALFVRMYACTECGTILNTKGLKVSTNGTQKNEDQTID